MKSTFRIPYVWFSDKLILRRSRSPGWILAKLAQENGIKVDESKIDQVFSSAFNSSNHQKELLNPLLFKTPNFDATRHYKKWLEDIISDTVNGMMPLFMGLNNLGIFKHKAVLRLMERKHVHLNEDLRKLLIGLQKHRIPFGVIANEGPHVKSFFRHIGRLELEYSPFPIRNIERIPIINSMDDGHGKPHSHIYKRAVEFANSLVKYPSNSSQSSSLMNSQHEAQILLPILNGDQYFVGCNPTEDIVGKGDSFNLKSIMVTTDLPEPISDIKLLDTAAVLRLQSFRVSDISELYRVFFGDHEANHYLTNDLFHITDSPLVFDSTFYETKDHSGLKTNTNFAEGIADKQSSVVPGLDSNKESVLGETIKTELNSNNDNSTKDPSSKRFTTDKTLDELD